MNLSYNIKCEHESNCYHTINRTRRQKIVLKFQQMKVVRIFLYISGVTRSCFQYSVFAYQNHCSIRIMGYMKMNRTEPTTHNEKEIEIEIEHDRLPN